MNWVDVDKGETSLKALVKSADYIRILPRESKLYYSYTKDKNIEGVASRVTVIAFVKMPISLTINGSNVAVEVFHLHGFDADTLKTLLALNPSALDLRYYPYNQCTLYDNLGISGESLTIRGVKRNKSGKVVKSFQVSISAVVRKKGIKTRLGVLLNLVPVTV